MNSCFQDKLLNCLQGSSHNNFNSFVACDESVKKGSGCNLIGGRSCKTDNITTKIVGLISREGLSDIQLLDRICILCKIKSTIKDKLLHKLDGNLDGCVHSINSIIVMRDGCAYDDYLNELQERVFSVSSKEIKFDISTLVCLKDYEKNKCFYDRLGEWVCQSANDERRVVAADIIINTYEKSLSNLDLQGLRLTDLPSVIEDLPFVRTVNIKNNKFTIFPECLYKRKYLEINLLENNLSVLTPGLKKIILAGGCDINVDGSMHGSINELKCIHNIGGIYEDIFLVDRMVVQDTNELDYKVVELLKSVHLSTLVESTPQTQKEFKCAINEFGVSGKTGVAADSRVRSFVLGGGGINIIGCSTHYFLMDDDNPCIPSVLKFMYRNVNLFVHLVGRGGPNVLEFLKNCSGVNKYSPIQVISMEVKDYSFPRLEQYKIILQALCDVRNMKVYNKPKAMMISCGAGEGRSGSFMALLRLFEKFKQLTPFEKKQFDMDKTSFVEDYNGTFKRLSKEFRTTRFIANTVNELRIEEKDSLVSGISVETPEQFMSLEFMHLMLVINARVQNDASITDNQILEWLYNSNNKITKDFIMEFGDIYYTKCDDNALTEVDMLHRSEKHILQTIKTINTVI